MKNLMQATKQSNKKHIAYGFAANDALYSKSPRLLRKRPSSTKRVILGFDEIGNLALVEDRNGSYNKFCYDSFNRLVAAEYGTSDTSSSNYNTCTTNVTVTYTWDAGNRLTSATDSSGTITRIYDSLDRLTEESGPTGMIDYTYYANNLRHTMTVSGQPACQRHQLRHRQPPPKLGSVHRYP
jgi:YD repeat-containing protein